LYESHHSGQVQYANYSGWDVYRDEIPLLAVVAPQQAGQMMSSLLNDQAQGGWLPKWGFANDYTDIMNGDAADPILAEAYAFGARNFDARAALAAMVKGATRRRAWQRRPRRHELLVRLGQSRHLPRDPGHRGARAGRADLPEGSVRHPRPAASHDHRARRVGHVLHPGRDRQRPGVAERLAARLALRRGRRAGRPAAIRFSLTGTADTSWGSAAADAPPSYPAGPLTFPPGRVPETLVPTGPNLLGDTPAGQLSWQGPVENGVGAVPGTITPDVTTPQGASAVEWTETDAAPNTWIWVNPTADLTGGQMYQATITLQGSGDVYLDFYNGQEDLTTETVQLTSTPVTLTLDGEVPGDYSTPLQVRTAAAGPVDLYASGASIQLLTAEPGS
jgi:hypothetical protein